MRTYADPPVVFVRGAGSDLFDADGRRYLDFVSGIAVTSLGHAHPDVAAALCAQARTLWHVSNLYGNALAPAVASTLDRLIGGGTDPAGGQVFFCNSGAEANECAFKLARRWAGPGHHVVVATDGSFHGRTLAALAATGQPEKHAPFAPMPEGFVHVPYDDLDAAAVAIGQPAVAAFVVEAVQGEGGVVVPSAGYLPGLRRLCTDRGALLVCDEVQTGLGRTGRWFGFQAHDVRPDVVTVAKALGNGMPVGACWASAEVASAFGPGDHATTFGGQPIAMSAVDATLAVMEREDVRSRALARGAQLRRALEGLPRVAAVRGEGLLLGAVLSSADAPAVAAAALGQGLLVNPVRPDTLRLAPSLLVTEAVVDEAVSMLAAALSGAGPGGVR
jgi:acetylornithine/N-succinyldiaminopimelate aminotransferase